MSNKYLQSLFRIIISYTWFTFVEITIIMSSTLISKIEQGTVEELEKALTEAKAKGATHFQIGQSLCGTKKSGPLYYAEVIQFRKELSPVEVLQNRLSEFRDGYNRTMDELKKELSNQPRGKWMIGFTDNTKREGYKPSSTLTIHLDFHKNDGKETVIEVGHRVVLNVSKEYTFHTVTSVDKTVDYAHTITFSPNLNISDLIDYTKEYLIVPNVMVGDKY